MKTIFDSIDHLQRGYITATDVQVRLSLTIGRQVQSFGLLLVPVLNSLDGMVLSIQDLFRRLGEPITEEEAKTVVRDMSDGTGSPRRGISFEQFLK